MSLERDGLGVVGVDGRGLVSSCDERAALLLGRAAATVVGEPVTLLLGDARPLDGEREVLRGDGAVARITVDVRALGDVAPDLALLVLRPSVADARRDDDERARRDRHLALAQLATTVGHELRNPLTAIRNAWHYLQKRIPLPQMQEVDDRLPRVAGLIVPEIERCNRIIGDLLEFARDRQPRLEAVELRPLVDGALAKVVRVAPGVVLKNDVDEAMPRLVVDEDQVQQAILQLAQNAADALAARGSGVVRVSARATGDATEIAVEDDGPGVPHELRERVFEPLFSTRPRGFGLGLAIVASAARRHGGDVTLESEPDRGATFRLRLPRRTA